MNRQRIKRPPVKPKRNLGVQIAGYITLAATIAVMICSFQISLSDVDVESLVYQDSTEIPLEATPETLASLPHHPMEASDPQDRYSTLIGVRLATMSAKASETKIVRTSARTDEDDEEAEPVLTTDENGILRYTTR
ncbi:MAG: hypothetical protein AAF517_25605 [Planctomycetota bacterium]